MRLTLHRRRVRQRRRRETFYVRLMCCESDVKQGGLRAGPGSDAVQEGGQEGLCLFQQPHDVALDVADVLRQQSGHRTYFAPPPDRIDDLGIARTARSGDGWES